MPFAELAGQVLVVEEKLDGANARSASTPTVSCCCRAAATTSPAARASGSSGRSRRGRRRVAPQLWPRLGDRYVLYGEWLYAKHTVFYDALPHYFCEFDVLDRADRSVPVDTPAPPRAAGRAAGGSACRCCTPGRSRARRADRAGRPVDLPHAAAGATALREAARDRRRRSGAGRRRDRPSDDDGGPLRQGRGGRPRCVGRYKWVRPSFLHRGPRLRHATGWTGRSWPNRAEPIRRRCYAAVRRRCARPLRGGRCRGTGSSAAFDWVRRAGRRAAGRGRTTPRATSPTHTRMACEALAALPAWRARPADERVPAVRRGPAARRGQAATAPRSTPTAGSPRTATPAAAT